MSTLLEVVAFLMIVAGVAAYSWPAGLIVAGVGYLAYRAWCELGGGE